VTVCGPAAASFCSGIVQTCVDNERSESRISCGPRTRTVAGSSTTWVTRPSAECSSRTGSCRSTRRCRVAITHALEQLDQDEVRINVLHEAAGDITDNDIMLAAASNAIVVGFSTSITETARRAAEAEGVDVRLYDIIYKLTDDIDAALKGLLEPEEVEIVEGRAEVRQVIRVGKNTVIAGSYVTDGRIVRGGARVWRGGKVIATDRIESLRRFRDDVREVQTNYECGIGLASFHDIEEGDVIECFTTQMVSRAATPA
jgi:translation initiation factor IF-2